MKMSKLDIYPLMMNMRNSILYSFILQTVTVFCCFEEEKKHTFINNIEFQISISMNFKVKPKIKENIWIHNIIFFYSKIIKNEILNGFDFVFLQNKSYYLILYIKYRNNFTYCN